MHGQESVAVLFKLLRSPGIDSTSRCSLAGLYDNPIPTRFLAPTKCLKLQHRRKGECVCMEEDSELSPPPLLPLPLPPGPRPPSLTTYMINVKGEGGRGRGRITGEEFGYYRLLAWIGDQWRGILEIRGQTQPACKDSPMSGGHYTRGIRGQTQPACEDSPMSMRPLYQGDQRPDMTSVK